MSEFGLQSWPAALTMAKVFPADQWSYSSDMSTERNHHPQAGHSLIRRSSSLLLERLVVVGAARCFCRSTVFALHQEAIFFVPPTSSLCTTRCGCLLSVAVCVFVVLRGCLRSFSRCSCLLCGFGLRLGCTRARVGRVVVS